MGTLLRQALTLTRLRAAFERVAQNNGQPGVDGLTVDAFGLRLESKLAHLQTEVLGGRYQPFPLARVWLPRPNKPPRPLGIPTVRDRVLHTALAQTITPLLEAEFEDCSYAYRQGRSVRMAVERIGLLQRQGYRWVVEADIERFFDRIPHARLLAELRAVVPDDELVALVGQCMRAPVQEGEHCTPVTIGVPQGSPISPLLSNLYLDHLDDALLDDKLALVRYADDFIILTKSHERAQAAVELTAAVLQDPELKLNPLKTRVVNFETGFEFLGWNFVRSLAVPVKTAGDSAGPPVMPVHLTQAQPQAPSQQPQDALTGEMSTAFAEALASAPAWRPGADADADAEQAEPPEPEERPEPSESPAALEPAVLTVNPPQPEDMPASADEPPADEVPTMPPPSLQRTLYLLDPAASLSTENRHLIVRRDTDVLLDLPAVSVDQVMLFGRNQVTPAAWICCAQHGIPVAYLSRMGKFYGRFEGYVPVSCCSCFSASEIARPARWGNQGFNS